jgi:hypothetical protein
LLRGPSTGGSSGPYVGDQGFGSPFAQSWARTEADGPPLCEEISNSLGSSQGLIGSAHPEGVGPYDDRNRLAVPGECHLLAGKNPVEDLG